MNNLWEYNYSYSYIAHHGILGQKWGIRRYQNEDGSLTPEGKARLEKYKEKQLARIKNDRYSEYKRTAIEQMTFEQMTTEQRAELMKDIAFGLKTASAIAAPVLGATVVAPWMSAKALEIFSKPEVREKVSGILSDLFKSEVTQTAITEISSDAIKLGKEVMSDPSMQKMITETILEENYTKRKNIR